MDWQQVSSLIIVGVTAILLLRRQLRLRGSVGRCGAGSECKGCSAAATELSESHMPRREDSP